MNARLLPGLLLCAGALTATFYPVRPTSAQEALRVENIADGTVIRYPVAFLRGQVTAPDGTEVRVVNTTSRLAEREYRAYVGGNRFKALIQLVPGENRLELISGTAKVPFRLTFQPPTNDHKVRFFYFTAQDGDTTYPTQEPRDPQDYAAKLDTVAKLMQTFTAERMHDAGYGRKTFNLELGADGRLVVHTVRGPRTAEYYQARTGNELYSEIWRFMNQNHPDPRAKNVVVMAFTRYDEATMKPKAHTALGGGNLGLFGSAGMFVWPSRIRDTAAAFNDVRRIDPRRTFDDSNSRSTYWGLASTTLGAVLHETGHAIGLPHTRDGMDIMTRGFDHLNRFFTLAEPRHARRPTTYNFPETEVARWGPVSSGRLAYNRWMQADARDWKDAPPPTATVEAATSKLRVRAEHGLRVTAINSGGDGVDNELYRADTPKEVEYDLDTLTARGGGGGLGLSLIDDQGNQYDVPPGDLVNPADFVRTWRLDPQPVAWPSSDAFIPADLASIVTRLRGQTPRISAGPHIDLLTRYGGGSDNKVSYAYAVLRSPRDLLVKLLTGSDDALRVWINGHLVVSKLLLRGATPDSDVTPTMLKAGDNPVLVEVSNAGGGWGFFFRLEDSLGRRLRVAPDGTLTIP